MSLIDNVIGYFSPEKAASRALARMNLKAIEQMEGIGGAQGAYSGASGNRQDNIWINYTGQNPVLTQELSFANGNARKFMLYRAKQLCQNNAIASGILQRAVENIVGNGFTLNVESSDKKFNDRIEAAWNQWCDTADLLGHSWLEHQILSVKSWLRDGDFGSIWTKDGRLQPRPAEYIESPIDQLSDVNIIDGVKVSNYGTPLQYFINTFDGYARQKSQAIDAANFIFLANKEEFSQYRGESVFTTSFSVFDQLDQWQLASLHAAKLQAFMVFAIQKQNVQDALNASAAIKPPINPSGVNVTSPTTPPMSADDKYRLTLEGGRAPGAPREQKWESGSVNYLKPGESISGIGATHPAANFTDNFRFNVRSLGLRIGFPLELLLLDFSQGNFSSQKIALLQAQRSMKQRQTIYATQYLRRIFTLWLTRYIKDNNIKAPADAFHHRFIATPWAYLDPITDIQALQMQIDVGTETLSSILSAQGKDFGKQTATRGEEIAKIKELGIPHLHSQALTTFGNDETEPKVTIDTTKPITGDVNE